MSNKNSNSQLENEDTNQKQKDHISSNENTKTNNDVYDASKIVVLEFPYSVRKLPGMYIGDPNDGGLEHIVKEILDNSVDEYFAGYANNININFLGDNTVEVEDNGRGMPPDVITYTDKQGNTIERSGIETIFTVLHAGAKSGGSDNVNGSYKISGGLHGLGAAVVCALSEFLEVFVYRDYEYYMKFEKGIVTVPLEKREKTNKKGTLVRFQADKSIFTNKINENALLTRVEEIAYLNNGLTINFKNALVEKSFSFPNGLLDFMKTLIGNQKPLLDSLYYISKEDNFEAYVVFNWCMEYEGERYALFTNNIPQPDGGYHLTGLKIGIYNAIKKYLDNNSTKDYIAAFMKNKIEIIGDDTRNGIHCICSIRCQNPLFASQTKTKLASPFVKAKVEKLVFDNLSEFLEKNPPLAKKLLEEIFANATARSVAKEEKKKVLAKIDEVDSFSIPGKLAECDKRTAPEERELIIVEGESAGGTVKQARDRKTQAVLSLFGKISNVMRLSTLKILNTESLMTILAVLGINIHEDEESYKSKLRYHKVIIMVDADVDGGHIRTLLLTFFYKCAPYLLKNGHIYICRPPLYGVRINNKLTYLRNEESFKEFVNQKLYDDYEFKSPKDKLDINNIKKILSFGEYYKKNLQQIWRGDISLEALSYFVFIKNNEPNISVEEFNNVFQLEFSSMTIKENNEEYIVEERTIYGLNQYVISNWNIQIEEEILNLFPLEIISKNKKSKIILNPIDLFNYLENIINKIDIQRYKGLGEMTASQLFDSTINISIRNLIQVHFTESLENIKIINDLMTTDGVGERKKLIIDGI